MMNEEKFLKGESVKGIIIKMVDDIIERNVNAHSNSMDHMDEWDITEMRESLNKIIPFPNFQFSEEDRDKMNKAKFIRNTSRIST
jgi:preprotein translocase subunit SecA